MDVATTAELDLAATRARFPGLARTAGDGRPLVHADAPGGTQVLDAVIEAMATYLATSNANSHGPFVTSRETDELCARVRTQAAGLFGASAEGVVFGPNMTSLTWHFARAFARTLAPGDEIVCTRLDHDANVAPWLAIAEEAGATVRFVELDASTGRLALDSLDRVVTPRTRLVAFPLASNALGTVVDPAPFVGAARAVGALTFADAVHAAPHVALAQESHGIDVVVASPYKFFGPHAGLLSAAPGLLGQLRPDKVRPSPDQGPERWQTGTASFEAIAGTGAALRYLEMTGFDRITAAEGALSRRFLQGLADLRRVRLHGPPGEDGRTPTFAITVAGLHPDAVAERLAALGIFVWAGHYYAVEPMNALGLMADGGAVRIGFVHYHGPDDVDRVLEALAGL